MRRAAVLLPLALAACTKAVPPPEVQETGVPTDLPPLEAPKLPKPANPGAATPMQDRVATIGVLNKRNYLEKKFTMKPGDSQRFGNAIIRLAACEQTAPWEWPKQTGAFVQVFVRKVDQRRDKAVWNKIFSGWLFKESPSLNVVEDPVYDVWVDDCKMTWAGDAPVDLAAPSSAAKASGNVAASSPAATSSNAQ